MCTHTHERTHIYLQNQIKDNFDTSYFYRETTLKFSIFPCENRKIDL